MCSNHNETFATDCDLYRKRCLCEESATDEDEIGASACGEDNMYSHVHVEYYGECQKDKYNSRWFLSKVRFLRPITGLH